MDRCKDGAIHKVFKEKYAENDSILFLPANMPTVYNNA